MFFFFSPPPTSSPSSFHVNADICTYKQKVSGSLPAAPSLFKRGSICSRQVVSPAALKPHPSTPTATMASVVRQHRLLTSFFQAPSTCHRFFILLNLIHLFAVLHMFVFFVHPPPTNSPTSPSHRQSQPTPQAPLS